MSENAPELPGLTPPPPPPGPIALAANKTIDALTAQGLILQRHAVTCEVVRQLATAVDKGLAAPRVSVATSTLARHLIEAIESLPSPDADTPDAWDALQALLHDQVKAGTA